MEVRISSGVDTIVFNLTGKNLALEDLQTFFPGALGLRYFYDGNYHIVLQRGNSLLLLGNVREYIVLTKEDVQERDDLFLMSEVRRLFYLRYQYLEICDLLKVESGITISLRNLKRLLQEMGLKRKNVEESPRDLIIDAISKELRGSGMNIGYRPMWQRLRKDYNSNVLQKTVLELMNELDPAGIEKRSRYRLKRREHSVPGPNSLWHVDGFDKLKKFGFAINDCVDGFSRKVIWLHVATTNNDPRVIAYYFLNSILEHGCIPARMRSDRGTGNQMIEVIQRVLRHYHTDEHARENSFLKGRSTANGRIEKYWKQLRNSTVGFFIDLFKLMEEKKVLDSSDIVDIEILRFCFGKIIQNALIKSTQEWNEHRMRKQKNIRAPSGIPNMMYYCPARFGGIECKKSVDSNMVPVFIEMKEVKPKLYNNTAEELIRILKPNVTVPNSPEESYQLFMEIRRLRRDVEA